MTLINFIRTGAKPIRNEKRCSSAGVDCLLVFPASASLTHIPPLGLGYLAAALQKEGLTTDILDAEKLGLDVARTAQEILQRRPKTVGFSMMTCAIYTTMEVICYLRAARPQLPVIIGGAHASALPRQTVRDLDADVAVVGEGDEILPEIVRRFINGSRDFGDLRALAWKSPDGVQHQKGRHRLNNLSKYPMPDWSLIAPEKYPRKPGQLFYKRWPVSPIIMSRGCDYACSYCSTVLLHGVGMRTKPIHHVLAEIEYLYHRHGVRELHWQDDNFTGSHDYVIKLCHAIADLKLKDLVWKTPVGMRIDELDEEMLDAFFRSGCYQVGFGLESADPDVLAINNKRQGQIDTWYEKLRLCKHYGIETYAYLVVGLPGDTEAAVKATTRFVRDASLDYIHVSMFTPVPGSPYFARYLEPDLPENPDWSLWTWYGGFEVEGWLTLKEMHHLRRRMLIEFFVAKPQRVWNIVRHLRIRQFPHFARICHKYLGGWPHRPLSAKATQTKGGDNWQKATV